MSDSHVSQHPPQPALHPLDARTWQGDGRPVPEVQDGLRYLIGGEIREWRGPTQQVQSCPFFTWNGSIVRPSLGPAPMLDGNEAMAALAACEKAWNNGNGEWPTTTVGRRIDAMQHFTERMIAVRETVCERMMWEIGKTQTDCYREFDRTVQYIKDTIEALKTLDRNSAGFSVEKGFLAQIRRAPIGPALCMGPYNYPLNETFTTLIPAILMGNPVISKLPRYGIVLNSPLLEAFQQSFPPGVVNVIVGRGMDMITPMMDTGRLELLAFIGASKTADKIKAAHPHPHRLKSVLSLDAKNLAVVLPDADLQVTVSQLLAGALGFNGQRCTALKMIFIHRSRRDEILSALSDGISKLKAGHPWTPGVQLTPLADQRAADWLCELVDEATKMGAKIVNPHGGERLENYLHPALLFPTTPAMQVQQVEQFGPVIPVCDFEDTCEVIQYAIDSHFGQQVSVFGYDPKILGPLIDHLVNQVSRVNLNVQCQRGPDTFPFTGRKASAEGTLSVGDALRRFSIRALVATDYSERNRELVNAILAARSSNFLRTDFLF